MNNFRPHQPKNSFGARVQQGSDLNNPWITDDEIMNIRRQNPQFHPLSPNVMPNMQSPLLNQPHLLPTPNKNYVNQSSCKKPSSSFMHSPNPGIVKHSISESNFQNRFVNDRFSNNNSFSNVNTQYKMNEGPLIKDFPGSNTIPPQSRKNESFPDISKQLFPNLRQPPERFACMQNDQTSFHQKFDSSQTFQGKGFPFTNDKAFLSSNSLPYCEKPPSSLPASFTTKTTCRAPNLFPAYTPKDAVSVESGSKGVQEPACSFDFSEKSSSFCDTAQSSSFIKAVQTFQEKALQFGTLETVLNEFFQDNSSFFDKPSFKDISNVEDVNESLKTPMETVSCSSDKFPFTTDNQQSYFQTSSDISFQKSQSLQFSSQSNSALSKECLLQSTAFTAETNVHQSLKESIPASNCSFNFESNISSADLYDLLPGIDAFLKEAANKPEAVLPKTDVSKANSAFPTDMNAWPKPSIPFIGDIQTSCTNNLNVPEIDTYCSETPSSKKGYSDKPESRSEKISDEKPSVVHQKNESPVRENHQKNDLVEEKVPKINSTLEEAIDTLVTNDAIVGLDYIIEYKNNINRKGSFPFKCKLCNSAISRPTIIDHIIGSKHRMRYLKAKDEVKYKSIISLNSDESEREAVITVIAFQLEKIFGRGHVVVETAEVCEKDSVNSENSASEDTNADPPVVFTLDKIPIGFEALSPQHDDVHSTTFSLDADLNSENQDMLNTLQKENESITSGVEIKKEAQKELSTDCGFSLPGLSLEFTENNVPDSSSLIPDELDVDSTKNSEPKSDHSSMSTQPSSLPSVQSKVKRSASPDPFCQFKQQKVSDATDTETSSADNIADSASFKIKTENSPSREKSFTSDLLEELSKCIISSDEEASFALQAVNILIQMLLRYKLQHISLEVVENMMRSLRGRSPDKIEELMTLLKDSKMFEDEDDPQKASLLKSEPLPSKIEEKMDETLTNHPENINQNPEPTLTTKNVLDSFSAASFFPSNSGSSSAVSNTMFPVSAAPTISASNVMNVHSNVVSNVAGESGNGLQTTSAMNTQTSSSAGLKPPPFFTWPQASETAANTSSYAGAQGNQNMMWGSPYQHSQTQFAQMPFYQAQGYGNAFTGNQTYQSQYSVMPQSSVPLKMVNPPPLPPPPPPPPPAPNNPPLPPMPKSAEYSATSHSVPFSSNPLSCLPLFSKPPPPPPSTLP